MDTTQTVQDLFISHANSDKQQYVLPITDALKARGVSYFLDCESSAWGDSFVAKINEWFKNSRWLMHHPLEELVALETGHDARFRQALKVVGPPTDLSTSPIRE